VAGAPARRQRLAVAPPLGLREHGAVEPQRRLHLLDADSVVGAQRRGLAVAADAVAVGDRHGHQRAFGYRPERAAQRPGQAQHAPLEGEPHVATPPPARMPAESSTQKISCRAPVLASARLSEGPSTRLRTTPTTPTANGMDAQLSISQGDIPSAHSAGAQANAATTIAVYIARERSRPSRTTSVRLPARLSVSMSRTLFTTTIALASSPTGTATANPCHGSFCTCTKYAPTTATIPKNRNTNSSPRPSSPYGRGPPV